MELLRIVWRDYRWPFVGVVLLSLTSAGLGIGVIAFINQRLLGSFADPWRILPEFLGLIALLLVITLASQLALTTLGHHFVYRLRGQLVKRILDTSIERAEQIGSARLLASLSTDVSSVTCCVYTLAGTGAGRGADGRCYALLGMVFAYHAGRHRALGDRDGFNWHTPGGSCLWAYGQTSPDTGSSLCGLSGGY